MTALLILSMVLIFDCSEVGGSNQQTLQKNDQGNQNGQDQQNEQGDQDEQGEPGNQDDQGGQDDQGEQGEEDEPGEQDDPSESDKPLHQCIWIHEIGLWVDYGLDIETEVQIADYWWKNSGYYNPLYDRHVCQILGSEYMVQAYYGYYNDYHIVQRAPNQTGMLWAVRIEDVQLNGTRPGLTAWKDGQEYSFLTLINQGLLSRADLLMIGEYEAPSRYLGIKVYITFH